MTEKLYYKDSYIRSFRARVTACVQTEGGFEVTLDRTAFFPEGGGQAGDSGYIGPVRVNDTHEKNGDVWHYVNQSLEIGTEYDCGLDWELRFRRMQNHSGEHIVSGLVHEKLGFNNVGFHMGHDFVTIDFDGDISAEALRGIEREANMRVAADLKILTYFPDAGELQGLEYRSKLELSENVRIVEIEGTDRCACCAPHVRSTAGIGIIKILASERRRRGGDGVRVTMLCGLDAYNCLTRINDCNTAVSQLLSAKRDETAQAVERLLAEQERLRARSAVLGTELAGLKAGSIQPTDGNVCIFDSVLDEPALREIVNAAASKCGGIAGVFSGNDAEGYRYIIGSRSVDLRAHARELNSGISGRGGGKPGMIQGSCTEKAQNIAAFFESFKI